MKKNVQIILYLISLLVIFSCKQNNNEPYKKTIVQKKTVKTDLCLIWYDEISKDYLSIILSDNLSKVDYFNENGMFHSTEDNNGELNYKYSGDTIYLNFKINCSYKIFVDMLILRDVDSIYNYTIITNEGLDYMPQTGRLELCQ